MTTCLPPLDRIHRQICKSLPKITKEIPMFRTLMLLALFALVTAVSAQTTLPNSFTSGATISASQVNANFTTLLNALNALQTTVTNQAATITALQGDIPLGSILASYTAPDASLNYMTGSTVWAFADGSLPASASSYTGQFPDMRGQFIRGVNANRADGKEDPDSAARTGGDLNKAGSFQADAFQGHAHQLESWAGFNGSNGSFNPNPQGYGATGPYGNTLLTKTTTSDGTNGNPRTAKETRPENLAVYWYVKVK